MTPCTICVFKSNRHIIKDKEITNYKCVFDKSYIIIIVYLIKRSWEQYAGRFLFCFCFFYSHKIDVIDQAMIHPGGYRKNKLKEKKERNK